MSTIPDAERGAAGAGWIGQRVIDRDGSRVGKLEHVYFGRDSQQPTWGVVKSGRKHRFVPLQQATPDGESIRVLAGKRQVRSAPAVPLGPELSPEMEAQLSRHYADEHAPPPQDADIRHGDAGSLLSVPRSRGALSGLLLIPLGIWGAIIPFVGPYFDYTFGIDEPWLFTLDRLWLSILPGIAVLLGGLLLAPSANRVSGVLGAWLALTGGIWFVIGPALSQLWDTASAAAPIGQPQGGDTLQALEQVGYFYGLGALVTALAAFALGRLAVLSTLERGARRRTAWRPPAR